jgi:cytoplasmic iron level regulating protein YaaA (DUF328/UPF0246 family)
MIILLHSSKTMRSPSANSHSSQHPELLNDAEHLAEYLSTLSPGQLMDVMHISENLAHKTHLLLADWSSQSNKQIPAIDSFLGDIYSGLQVSEWSLEDRLYANNKLRILSGLYGILRPLDGIYPYRLELSYRLPAKPFANLYSFWGARVAATLPASSDIVNLSSLEYSKVILPFVQKDRVITPVFLSIKPEDKEPVFVAVHAKIARGAYARWLILERIKDTNDLSGFKDLGYRYDKKLSSARNPVYVCREFGGKGLSVRLS